MTVRCISIGSSPFFLGVLVVFAPGCRGTDEAAVPRSGARPAAVAVGQTATSSAPEPKPLAEVEPAPKLDAGVPAFPPPERPLRVLILGDSLAATGFGALLERRLDAHSDVACFRRAKSATGLARPDFFDWMGEARTQVDRHDPHLVVVVMGGNDGQDLQPRRKGEGPRVHWQTPEWEGAYRERMDEFLAIIGGPERRVLWLGLPTMGITSFENKLTLIRRVQREAIEALGDAGSYVDTAPFVSDDSGKMLVEAELDGRKRTIRADDRIHFTMAGSEYFANVIYPEVLEVLGLDDEPEATDVERADKARDGGARPQRADAQ